MDFNSFFNLIISIVVGYIGYTIKERDNRIKERDNRAEKQFGEIEATINRVASDLKESEKNMYKCFVTKDEHSRDMNALERKIDDIKDLLMGIKEDIGHLNGRNEK